jgi:hypothetical protein
MKTAYARVEHKTIVSKDFLHTTPHDDMQANEIPAADEQLPFLCSADELNESLCRMEEEFFQGKTVGLTSAQMRKKHAL